MVPIQSSDQSGKLLNNDIINEYYDDHLNNEINYYNPNNHHYYHQSDNVYSSTKTNTNLNNNNINNNNYAIFNNLTTNCNASSNNNTNQTNKINIVINKKTQQQSQPQIQLQPQSQQQSQHTQQQNQYSSHTQQILQPVQPQQSSQIQQKNQIIITTQATGIPIKNNNSNANINNSNNVNNNVNKRLSKDLSHKNLPPIRTIISSDNLKEMNTKNFHNKNEKLKDFNNKLKQNMSKQHDQIKFNNSDKPPLASSGSSGIVNQVKKKFEKLEKSSTANIIIAKSTSTTSTIQNKNNNNNDNNSNVNLKEKNNLNLKLKPASNISQPKLHQNHKIQTVTLSLDEKFSNHNSINTNCNNLVKNNSHLLIKQSIESNTKLIQKSSKLCTNKSNDKLGNVNNNINSKTNFQPHGINNKPIYSNNLKKHQIINNSQQQSSNACIYGRYYPNKNRVLVNDLDNKDSKLTEMKSVEIKKVDNNKINRPSTNNLSKNDVLLETQSQSTVVSQPHKPLFKPPNTEDLMKPTIRGAPSGLLSKLGSSNEMLPNEFTVYNFQPREAKKINPLVVEKLPDPITKLPNRKLNNNKINVKKQTKEKEKESNVVINKSNSDNKLQDQLNTTMEPKSPDLEDFKIQPEKAFFNDNHFSINNRTSKLIIREKQLKSPKLTKKEEPILSAINLSFDSLSSSSTFKIVEKNDNIIRNNKKTNSNNNLITDEIVKEINKVIKSGSDRPISVELDLSVCYYNKNDNPNGNNKDQANININNNKSKNLQHPKIEFNINYDPSKTFDFEKDLKHSKKI